MQPVGGSISSLMTRYLYSATDSGKSWDSPVDLLARPEVLQDLHFWENNINSLNVKKLFEYMPPPTPPPPLAFCLSRTLALPVAVQFHLLIMSQTLVI